MGLTILVAQPVSISRAKLWKVVVKCEIVIFFNFWAFLKMYIFEVATLPIQSTKFFSVVVWIDKIHVFDYAFFLLAIVAMIAEKIYFSYFYGNLSWGKISS